MTFRVRIDPVALRQIDEFAAYLRNYDEDFAVSLLPPCHQRPTELPVAEGRKQKPLSRSRPLHQIEAPSCWHASIPSACPHRGVRSKGPYSARIVAAATPDPSLEGGAVFCPPRKRPPKNGFRGGWGMSRSKSLELLIPILYLKGVSIGDLRGGKRRSRSNWRFGSESV